MMTMPLDKMIGERSALIEMMTGTTTAQGMIDDATVTAAENEIGTGHEMTIKRLRMTGRATMPPTSIIWAEP
jgi:hypothetical protein